MKFLLRRLANLLAPYIDQCKTEDLRASLAHCGQGVSLRMPVVIESPANVTVMDGVSVASFVHMWGNGSIVIGARTMIGSHVAITSATHDSDADVMSGHVVTKPVRIGQDVWIGTHAVILPGVTIGDHAVVGAGAVVRTDVPPYAIVAGVPATFVRQRKSTV